MITRHLPAAERVASPWKNGGGVTREIAVWPEGAGMEAFDWRISTAEVRGPGAFSVFHGVDRSLSVLSGALSLSFAGGRVAFLDPTSEPYGFPGDVPCHGAPLGGPVTDLNVMWRRGRYAATIEQVEDAAWTPSGAAALLIALEPLAVGAESLSAHDALIFTEMDPAEAVPLHVGGRALGVRLSPLP
jgi:environmental stress-induced protein Ves